MLSSLKKLPVIRDFVKVVNLNFAELHHVRWILSKIYESTQAALERSDSLKAQIDSSASRNDQVLGALLSNDIAIINATAESTSLLERLSKDTQELRRDVSRLNESTIAALENLGQESEAQNAKILTHLETQKLEHNELLDETYKRFVESVSAITHEWRSSLVEEIFPAAVREVSSSLRSDLSLLQQAVEGATKALATSTKQVETLGKNISGKEPIWIHSDDVTPQNPEIALATHLYSYLPNRNAVDVGANIGDFSSSLLDAGYKVVAFEPFEPVFQTLEARFKDNTEFQAMHLGVGIEDGVLNLHVASDTSGRGRFPDSNLYNSFANHSLMKGLEFTRDVPVEVRSLESLRQSGSIPGEVAFLKVDTEGFDLEVLRGIGSVTCSVVMTEYWDDTHPFGRSGKGHLEDIVREMKTKGFPWFIAIYHLNNDETVSFYCNRAKSVPGAWGNILFFRENDIFAQARRWCEVMLRPTLFSSQ